MNRKLLIIFCFTARIFCLDSGHKETEVSEKTRSTYASALQKAIEERNLDVVKKMMRRKLKFHVKNMVNEIYRVDEGLETTLLLRAIGLMRHENDIMKEIIHKLIEVGASVNQADNTGKTPLMLAAQRGLDSIVKLLVTNGAQINAQDDEGTTALMFASFQGHKSIVGYLMDKRAQVNQTDEQGNTALMFAVRNPDIALYLFEHGADLRDVRYDGMTALLLAVQLEQIQTVKLLAELGADIEEKNNQGDNALMIAACKGYLPIVHYLLFEAGARLDRKNASGETALMCAAANGHLDVVEYLVSRGVSVNATSNQGATALLFAAQNGHLDVVKYLLARGASLENNIGNAAVDIALKNFYEDVASYLEEYMENKRNENEYEEINL